MKKDESYQPLSINCWPTPTDDGSCDVNIEYELENDKLALYDLLISIPLPPGRTPNVTTASGDWTINTATNTLDWSSPLVSEEEDNTSGSLEFSVPGAGDDTSLFFPVKVSFNAVGSAAEMSVASVKELASGVDLAFSTQVLLSVDEFIVG